MIDQRQGVPQANNDLGPTLSASWWIPSAAVMVALLLLLVVPAAIDRRVAGLRNRVAIGEHARTTANHIEAAFASRLLTRNNALPTNTATRLAEAARMSAENDELRSVMPQIDGQASVLYERFNGLFIGWEAAPHDQSTVAVQQGLELLAAAEKLDDYLATYVDSTRQRTMALSRYYVVIPSVLAPIAVLAMGLAMWLGRRLQQFAHVADAKRAEVIQAAEARAALLRGVTHDVKNPLAAAAGYASLLEEGIVGPITPEQREMVGRIHHLVGVSVQTVTDLLDLARADANLHVDYVATDLGALLTEVVDDHRGLAREHNLRLEVDAPRSPVITDPKRVRRIVTNILSNAIKYTPSGGELHATIASDPRAHRLGVAVRDTGPGIPPNLQSKVFEEFFRVRDASNGSSGNGLGLAISRRIARLLGGDVTYEPANGGGSVFTVWLPAADGSKR